MTATHTFARNQKGDLISRIETDSLHEARNMMNANRMREALEDIINRAQEVLELSDFPVSLRKE